MSSPVKKQRKKKERVGHIYRHSTEQKELKIDHCWLLSSFSHSRFSILAPASFCYPIHNITNRRMLESFQLSRLYVVCMLIVYIYTNSIDSYRFLPLWMLIYCVIPTIEIVLLKLIFYMLTVLIGIISIQINTRT